MDINIIYGAPGTGKTTTLLGILEKLLTKYKPSEIAYVSFSKEAVEQGKKRSIEKFNLKKEDFLYFATLHSMAFKSLDLRRIDVIQKKHYKLFSKEIGMNFTGYYTEDLKHNDDQYLFFDELYRNNTSYAKKYLNILDSRKIKYVRENYKKFKKTHEIVDYTDMIEMFNKENNNIPVKVAIIDEAQDLTTLQWRMCWTAFKRCEKVYIAGDDDQAIYQWSGADVNYFLNIEGNIKILDKSYRLPDNLLEFSKRISSQIDKRVSKDIKGKNCKGHFDIITGLEELNFNNNESWMILSRNNYFLKDVEMYLQDKGLLYYKKRESIVKEKDINIIKLFEKIRKDNIMSKREETTLRPYLNDKIDLRLPWYDNLNWPIEKINYLRNIIGNKNYNFDNINIKVGTIHSAKGDEADNVVVISDITKTVKDNFDLDPDSEHRVFYVACTRTKKNLYIMEAKTKNQYTFY